MSLPSRHPASSPSRGMLGGYTRIAALASVAGLRSMLPLFATAIIASHNRKAVMYERRPYAFLCSRVVMAGLGLATAGELVGDKLPTTPSRLAPLPLGGRMISGALVGAAAARRADLAVPAGAILGTVAAIGGALAGYHLRATLARVTDLPDRVWAVAEDVIAIGLAIGALAGEW